MAIPGESVVFVFLLFSGRSFKLSGTIIDGAFCVMLH